MCGSDQILPVFYRDRRGVIRVDHVCLNKGCGHRWTCPCPEYYRNRARIIRL